MIFTIGVCVFVIGGIIGGLFGETRYLWGYIPNMWDKISSATQYIGVLIVCYSLLVLSWKYLP